MPAACSCETMPRNSAAAATLVLLSQASVGSAAMRCTAARDSRPMPAQGSGRSARRRQECGVQQARSQQGRAVRRLHRERSAHPLAGLAPGTESSAGWDTGEVHPPTPALTLCGCVAGCDDHRVGPHRSDVRRALCHAQVRPRVLHLLA